MTRMTLSRWMRHGCRTRRALALVTIAVLCVMLVMVFAGAALAEESSGPPPVQTSEGMEAPELDYHFVWWSFILTFGLLIVYYVVVLRISNTEFKKIIDAHFGPKRDGR